MGSTDDVASPSASPTPDATPEALPGPSPSPPTPPQAPAPSPTPQATGPKIHQPAPGLQQYDIVIVGGSTAAIAAAIAAGNVLKRAASSKDGLVDAKVALLEPTDWVGGQLTTSAVCAVDWPNTGIGPHIFDNPENRTRNFDSFIQQAKRGGLNWVDTSGTTFLPKDMATLLDSYVPKDFVSVFYATVVKGADPGKGSDTITSLTALQAKDGRRTYDDDASVVIPTWYAEKDRGAKNVLTFQAKHDSLVLVDASEWGELLVLAGADYAVGAEATESDPTSCTNLGQAMVFDFLIGLRTGDGPAYATPGTRFDFLPADSPNDTKHEYPHQVDAGDWSGARDAVWSLHGTRSPPPDEEVMWHLVWTYRRVQQKIQGSRYLAHPGDISLQNWGYGNDYADKYLFKTPGEAKGEVGPGWAGGVRYPVMKEAETRARDWYNYLGQKRPRGTYVEILAKNMIGTVGTTKGLAKMPYIRDTRRSIGIVVPGYPNGFTMQSKDLVPSQGKHTALAPDDAVAIGSYRFDMHNLSDLKTLIREALDATRKDHKSHPYAYLGDGAVPGLFYIPFRALTNRTVQNLLVAGKTMAQSFKANAATRVHPIEWASGTAAGVAAAMMVLIGKREKRAISTKELYEKHKDELQRKLKEEGYTPIEWKLK